MSPVFFDSTPKMTLQNAFVFLHIHFISSIVAIYNELNNFFDKLEIKDVNVVYMGDNCKYFDTSAMLTEIKRYMFTHNCTLTIAQRNFRIKLRDFVLNMCEFAIVPDIYNREDYLKNFVYNNVCNIMNEQLYLDNLRKTVAVYTRQSYIDNEIFYYGYMMWIIRKIEVAGEYSTDYIWNHLFDKKFTEECIDKNQKELEGLICKDSFDIEFDGLSECFFECDDILSDIFQKTLFTIRIFEVNERIMQAPIANDEFNRAYRKLVESAMQSEVTFNALYNPTLI